jgi:hypothetical protein
MTRPGWPVAWAALLTLGNAAKPVVVDDTAYLLFARQIAADPTNPYGFYLFWYSCPEPAMGVLAPPVLPYWLAAGVRLFGEHIFLLKLWLFPFAWLFCRAAFALLRRFAPGREVVGTGLLALSPAALPLFNLMLDLPAAAIGLAAVAAFARGRWPNAVLAGLFAGLAMQTKYTMLTAPAVLLWYGLLHRRGAQGVVACVVAAVVFAAWELWLLQRYGVSHFLFHAADQSAGDRSKWELALPLMGYLGGLAVGWGLLAGPAAGFPRWVVRLAGGLAVVSYAAVCLTPGANSILLRNPATGAVRLDLPGLVFNTLGAVTAGTVIVAVLRTARDPAGWFLAGWVLIEAIAYFALTPFPGGRRVLPLCVPVGLLAIRLTATYRPERWALAFGPAVGVGLLALDTWDALPERRLAHRAAGVVGDPGPHRVWTQGHWGWQFYTDRHGMRLAEPGRTAFRPGDWLVLPVTPDEFGFYRPYHGGAIVDVDPARVEVVAVLTWDDWLPAQTIPTLYGGRYPVVGRDHPRLAVVVYRVTGE